MGDVYGWVGRASNVDVSDDVRSTHEMTKVHGGDVLVRADVLMNHQVLLFEEFPSALL